LEKDPLIRDIAVAEGNAEYDEHAKRILSDKRILAYIFKDTLEEVSSYTIDQIISMIEGEPRISSVAVDPGESNDPGLTRKSGNRIMGQNIEDSIPHEGGVLYDILTYLMVPGKDKAIKILINLEAQRNTNPGYDLVTRSVYYGARRISAQKGTEFFGSDYNSIKKSYSIWICFNAGRDEQGTVTEYAIRKKNVVGVMPDRERYDLMTSVFIRLCGRPQDYRTLSSQDLLMTIFSGEYTVQEIEERLSREYDFKFEQGFKKDVTEMCNLSYGIAEKNLEKGIAQGRVEGIAQGRVEGIAQGRVEGIAQGRVEGLAQGQVEVRSKNARKLAVLLNTTYEKALMLLEETDTSDRNV